MIDKESQIIESVTSHASRERMKKKEPIVPRRRLELIAS